MLKKISMPGKTMMKTIFSLLLFISCSAHSLHAIWSTPDTFGSISGGNPQVEVSTDSANGNTIAVWGNATAASVIQASIKPFGQNWGSATPLSVVGHGAAQPQVAMNSSGAAIAVWVDSTLEVIQASTYDPNSNTWSTSVTISNPPSGYRSTFPFIAIDSLGNAIAVWQDEKTDNTVSNFNATRFVNGAWSGVITNLATGVPVPGVGPNTMSVGVDASGNGVVVWVGNDGANFRISYATYTVSTDTWFIAPSFISTSGVNASNPFISVNLAGNAVMVWQQLSSPVTAQASTLNFVSGAWTTASSQQAISQATDDAINPVVAVDGSGNAVAVWYNFMDNTIHAASYTHSSNTWTTDQIISDTVSQNENPDVCVDTKGDAIAVWLNFGPANTSSVIGATQSFGGSWTTPQTISPAQVVAGEFPKVSDDATGYGVAVWGNHTLLELQSAHWTPAPTVLNVNPNSGPIAGGNTVTITGTNFTNFQDVTTINVQFGSTLSPSFTVTSRTTISAVVPPESTSLIVPVTITTQAGSGSGGPYTYIEIPLTANAPRDFHGRLYRREDLHFSKHWRLFTRWRAPLNTQVAKYKIYRDGKARYTLKSTKRTFKKFVTTSKKDIHKRYRISAVNTSGIESKKTKLKIVDRLVRIK